MTKKDFRLFIEGIGQLLDITGRDPVIEQNQRFLDDEINTDLNELEGDFKRIGGDFKKIMRQNEPTEILK